MLKTQIYLTPAQHRRLTREAKKAGISLTEFFRRMADDYLDGRVRRRISRRAVMSIVNLGSSGDPDLARDHHRALDEALRGPRGLR